MDGTDVLKGMRAVVVGIAAGGILLAGCSGSAAPAAPSSPASAGGGRHWTVLPEEGPLIRAVHFVSPSVGFAVAGGAGIILYGGAAPEVAGVGLATSDGGRTRHRRG